MFIPNPECCAPPHSVLESDNPKLVRQFLCQQCRSAFDQHYTQNVLGESNMPFVTNSPTWSDSGEPVQNQAESSPLPEFTLNYQTGKTPEIAEKNDLGGGLSCGCRNAPMPELTLGFAQRQDGGTVSSILANGHSFDDTIVGGGPIVRGGPNSTDSQYGLAPAMRQTPDEEYMGDESLHRIGLGDRAQQPVVELQQMSPVLSFRKGPNGETISEIV
jgi:hypothetical protein